MTQKWATHLCIYLLVYCLQTFFFFSSFIFCCFFAFFFLLIKLLVQNYNNENVLFFHKGLLILVSHYNNMPTICWECFDGFIFSVVVSNEKVTYVSLAKKLSCCLGELSTKMKLTNPFNGVFQAKKKKILLPNS
jgi:hypothetical protein